MPEYSTTALHSLRPLSFPANVVQHQAEVQELNEQVTELNEQVRELECDLAELREELTSELAEARAQLANTAGERPDEGASGGSWPVADSKVTVYTHTHTLTITCTCCYDVINGIQDLKIYSHADSLIISLSVSPLHLKISRFCPSQADSLSTASTNWHSSQIPRSDTS